MLHAFRTARSAASTLAPAFALATIGVPSSAAAQSSPVSIDISANIPPRCGFVPGTLSSQTGTPDLETPARFDIRLTLDCNTPYAFGVVAQAGQLANLDATADGSGFAFAKPYLLTVALDTDQGTIRSERCPSTTLVLGGECSFAASAPGSGLSSRRGVSINRDATLTIEWTDQSRFERRLAPGRYRDTLILVVGPRA